MAKSNADFLRLQSVIDRGFDPLAFRYFILSARYRSVLQFSWEALQQAATTLHNLRKEVASWDEATEPSAEYVAKFQSVVNDDLDTPTALSIVWEMVSSELDSGIKRATINIFEQVLGLGLHDYKSAELTQEEKALIDQREQARQAKDWATADKIRQELAKQGVDIKDTPQGTKWIKIA